MGDAGTASSDAVCPRCQRSNRLAAMYCGSCGLELSRDRPCPLCGSPNPRRHRFCEMCGGEMFSRDAPRRHPRPAPVRAGVGLPPEVPPAAALEPPKGALPRNLSASLRGAPVYAAGFVVAVAVLPRFYRLDSLPAGLSGLEDAFAATASRIAQEGWIGFGPGVLTGEPAGFAYLLGAWSLLAGDSTLALRLLPAGLGVLTVGLSYLLTRRLLGMRPALLASAILALSFWHLHSSRLILPTMLMLAAGLAVANLLTAALDARHSYGRRRTLGVAAGLVLAATLYVDNSFPILFAAVAIFCLVELVGENQPAREVVVALWIAAALPYLLIASSEPGAALERITAYSITATPGYQALQGITEQTRHMAASVGTTVVRVFFGALGDEQARLLDVLSGMLALVGLSVSVARWRERGHAFLLAFFGVGVALAGLTTEAGIYGRLVVALPAALAAAGFGLHWIMTWMKGRFLDLAVYGVAALLVALIAYLNLSAFFDPDPAVQ